MAVPDGAIADAAPADVAPGEAAPVEAAHDVDALFSVLTAFETVVLAVSGGADSTALLVLAAEWQRRQSSPSALTVATVDHRLRPQSATEAAAVARLAASYDLPHVTLEWVGDKPRTGIEAAARHARYALLGRYASSLAGGRPVALVTAHHANDQAETLLMRLARGSGIDGLAAMRPMRPMAGHPHVSLLRPLLRVERDQLRATLATRAIGWLDDPMNSDARHERVRWRLMEPALTSLGLTPAALTRSAARLADARDALAYADGIFRQTVGLDTSTSLQASFDRPAFDAGPRVLQSRLLRELIVAHGGATAVPELAEIERVIAQLATTTGSVRVTLGGALITAGQRQINLLREFGRIDPARIAMTPGRPVLWDNRYIICMSSDGPANLSVGALGRDGCAILDRGGHALTVNGIAIEPGAASVMPAIWAQDELNAVPLLDCRLPGSASCTVEAARHLNQSKIA